ncbi:GNAT family N-acetyltransferase [Spongiactinospora sp. 9N601]|uniref:GNAT family N-acetyltransferase n=1 Tax=Spongiactinospora sp. 9N601 TaxID=3375149 RepID=UPI00378B2845
MGETESEGVRLRAVRRGDLKAFLAQEHDPEAVRRARFAPRPEAAFMTHWTERILADPAVLVRTIAVDGEPGGHVISWWDDERRFIGYWLGRSYWGRGIGTTALTLFLNEEPVRPLYADPFAGNTASVRLLERLGFLRQGRIAHGAAEHILLALHGTP